jgi:hypothetical protein
MKIRRGFALAAVVAIWALFAASLCFPAFYLAGGGGRGESEFHALVVLFFGWMGIGKGSPGYLGWYANPLLLVASVSMLTRKYRRAVLCSVASVALALTSFLLRRVQIDEGGGERDIVGYGIGFYFWLSAIGLSMAASIGLCLSPGAAGGTDKIVIGRGPA